MTLLRRRRTSRPAALTATALLAGALLPIGLQSAAHAVPTAPAAAPPPRQPPPTAVT